MHLYRGARGERINLNLILCVLCELCGEMLR